MMTRPFRPLLFAVLALCLYVAIGSNVDTANKADGVTLDVIELTSKNFDTSVRDGNVWVVEFYAPWCSHCKTFAPLYKNVAMSFHSSPEEKIRVAKVDGSSEKALSTRFAVESFPCFFLVDGYSVYEFKQSRSVSNLMSFARGGYKTEEPIPMYMSPMGPLGLLQGFMLYCGSMLMDTLLQFQATYQLSPIVMGIMICGFGTVSTLLLMIIFVLLTHMKEKNE